VTQARRNKAATVDSLRQRILDEATRLFAEQGFSATSVRQLVEACECTKPSLYYYFESKETLFEQVIERHLQTCTQVIEALTCADGGARAAIHASLDGYISWAEANPNALRLLQRLESRPEDEAPCFNIAANRELHLQMITNLIERGMASGELRADIDPGDCALIIAGAFSLQFEMAVAAGRWDREQIHRTVDLIFDGIAA
jgi:AcrR family transcriptional regulator